MFYRPGRAGKDIEGWFQDGTRVGQEGSMEYVRAPIGSCPPMVRDTRYDSVHIFGAIGRQCQEFRVWVA